VKFITCIVREYVFYVFKKSKTRLFTFFEVAFQKRKNVIQKFQVSEYIQHYIKKWLILVCSVRNIMALVVALTTTND